MGREGCEVGGGRAEGVVARQEPVLLEGEIWGDRLGGGGGVERRAEGVVARREPV